MMLWKTVYFIKPYRSVRPRRFFHELFFFQITVTTQKYLHRLVGLSIVNTFGYAAQYSIQILVLFEEVCILHLYFNEMY